MTATGGRPVTLLFVEGPIVEGPFVEGADCTATEFESVFYGAAPAGSRFVRAPTPTDAFAYLETAAPDCAVVDISRTDRRGLALIDALATRAPRVPLIALGDRDELGVGTARAGPIAVLSCRAPDGNLLLASILHAIELKRCRMALDEVESVARVGSWDVDLATNVVTWSDELYRLLDFDLDHQPGYEGLTDRIHPDDRGSTVHAFATALSDLAPFEVEHRLMLPDGTERWVSVQGRVEVDADRRPRRFVGTTRDITERKAAAAGLLYRDLHDRLTGLPNRYLLIDRLDQALARLARSALVVGVIHVDVDRFSVVNDRLGYAAGDRLLLAIATRIAGLIRPEDTLARISGDEFIVLCEGLGADRDAIDIADRICGAMTDPFRAEYGDVFISVSAGIALAARSVDAATLLGSANTAMHRAKHAGRARTSLFTETMRTTNVGRLDTEAALRTSIGTGGLRLHYQAIVSLVDGRVLGHEALVRWVHPERGLLGPDEFIGLAEDCGLIVPLGEWVLREACTQAKRFQTRDRSWSELSMSVNISGAQLNQARLVGVVERALQEAQLSPQHLHIEMTESVLMVDTPQTITMLQSLHDLGTRLSIDDFGTGYSSLAYLRRFPVDVVKIDRTFVQGLGLDLEDSAIAGAIVNLADTLGLTCIAEGVETELQRDCLVSLGCAQAQGFLFARPVPARDAEAALDRVDYILLEDTA